MSFQNMMKELMKEYIESLPEKIATIGAHLQAKDIENLRNDFHKLKGTGKTYGIPEISDLGEVLEKLYLRSPDLAMSKTPWAISKLNEIVVARRAGTAIELINSPDYVELKSLINTP